MADEISASVPVLETREAGSERNEVLRVLDNGSDRLKRHADHERRSVDPYQTSAELAQSGRLSQDQRRIISDFGSFKLGVLRLSGNEDGILESQHLQPGRSTIETTFTVQEGDNAPWSVTRPELLNVRPVLDHYERLLKERYVTGSLRDRYQAEYKTLLDHTVSYPELYPNEPQEVTRGRTSLEAQLISEDPILGSEDPAKNYIEAERRMNTFAGLVLPSAEKKRNPYKDAITNSAPIGNDVQLTEPGTSNGVLPEGELAKDQQNGIKVDSPSGGDKDIPEIEDPIKKSATEATGSDEPEWLREIYKRNLGEDYDRKKKIPSLSDLKESLMNKLDDIGYALESKRDERFFRGLDKTHHSRNMKTRAFVLIVPLVMALGLIPRDSIDHPGRSENPEPAHPATLVSKPGPEAVPMPTVAPVYPTTPQSGLGKPGVGDGPHNLNLPEDRVLLSASQVVARVQHGLDTPPQEGRDFRTMTFGDPNESIAGLFAAQYGMAQNPELAARAQNGELDLSDDEVRESLDDTLSSNLDTPESQVEYDEQMAVFVTLLKRYNPNYNPLQDVTGTELRVPNMDEVRSLTARSKP